MDKDLNQDEYIKQLIDKQRQLLEARNRDLKELQEKLAEYQNTIHEKDCYLAKLEMDLEHAIGQCKKIAAAKFNSSEPWISRPEPGLESN
jgi:DNA-binding protein H-NS